MILLYSQQFVNILHCIWILVLFAVSGSKIGARPIESNFPCLAKPASAAGEAWTAIFAYYSSGIDVLVFYEVGVKGSIVSKMPVASGTVPLNKAVPRTVAVPAVGATRAIWWI
jgi:hypothetical protein